MILLTSALLMTSAASLDARVTDIELVKTVGEPTSWFNRIEVEFASGTEQTLRLCPSSAAVSTQRLVNGSYRQQDRYVGQRMTVVGAGQTGKCTNVALKPGERQRVTFVVNEVPGRWKSEDAYSVEVSAGNRLFRFVQPGRPVY